MRNNNKTINSKKNSGFTLIEFLIYSVIVSFIIGALTLAAINIMGSRTKVSVTEEVSHNGKMVLGIISLHVRNADSFTVSLAEDELSLQMPLEEVIFSRGESSDPGRYELLIQRGSSSPFPITTETVNVKDLSFIDASYEESPGTVKMEVTIEYYTPSGRKEYEFERIFKTTENLRK